MITHQEILDLGSSDARQELTYSLYGLIDHSGVTGLISQLSKTKTQWVSLFSGTKDEGAVQVAPILFAIQCETSSWHNIALLKWICQSCSYTSSLLLMISPLPLNELASRLAFRLDAELPGKMDVLLRFYDARIFESLVNIFSGEQKEAFLSPAHYWWYVDRKGSLKGVPASYSDIDAKEIPLRFTVKQESALLDASEPDQVADLLRTYLENELDQFMEGGLHDFIVANMLAAREWKIDSTHDYALYCSLAILYGKGFSEQKKWADALQMCKARTSSLTEAIKAAEAGDQE